MLRTDFVNLFIAEIQRLFPITGGSLYLFTICDLRFTIFFSEIVSRKS